MPIKEHNPKSGSKYWTIKNVVDKNGKLRKFYSYEKALKVLRAIKATQHSFDTVFTDEIIAEILNSNKFDEIELSDEDYTMVKENIEKFIELKNTITGQITEHSHTDHEGNEYWDCVMIQPGLASNGFYYTDEVLNANIDKFKFFQGKPLRAFANHPTDSEKWERPGRSVNDIVGHYDNIQYNVGTGVIARFYPIKESWVYNILKHSSELIDTSVVGAVHYSENVDENRNDTISFDYVSSCDIVTDGGAGGKFAQILHGIENVDNSDNIGGNKDMPDKDKIYRTVEEFNADYPDLVSKIVSNSQSEIYEQMKVDGEKKTLIGKIESLEASIVNSKEIFENEKTELEKTHEEVIKTKDEEITNAIKEKDEANDKLEAYNRANIAYELLKETDLTDKQVEYISNRMVKHSTKEDMESELEAFVGILLKENVSNAGDGKGSDKTDDEKTKEVKHHEEAVAELRFLITNSKDNPNKKDEE